MYPGCKYQSIPKMRMRGMKPHISQNSSIKNKIKIKKASSFPFASKELELVKYRTTKP